MLTRQGAQCVDCGQPNLKRQKQKNKKKKKKRSESQPNWPIRFSQTTVPHKKKKQKRC